MLIIFIIPACNKSYLENKLKDSNLSDDSEYLFVFGDIQEYTVKESMMSHYDSSIRWIIDQREYYDIHAVIYTGDITESNEIYQWQNFYEHTIALSDYVALISCIGNHDYSWSERGLITSRDLTYFSNIFKNLISKVQVIDSFEIDRLENIIIELQINDHIFNFIVLEFGPRIEVVNWARKFLDKPPKGTNILLNHEYLTPSGEMIGDNSTAAFQLKDSACTPEYIWENLVFPYNISCVLCGHNGFNSISFAENIRGSKVAQVLFNLQYQKNGGNGYIQIWEFPKDSRDVYMAVYDTVNREYITEKVYLFSY